MDAKQKKLRKLIFVGWVFICIFAIIFGIFKNAYTISIGFVILLTFKYIDLKYPGL